MGVQDRSILGLQIKTETVGQGDIDKLTASVDKLADSVQKQMERIAKQNDSAAASFRKLQADAEKSAGNLKNFISNPLAAAGQATESFVLKYGAIGGVVAGAGAAMAAGANYIARVHAEMAKAAESSVNFADRLGLSVSAGEQLSAMARIAGVDVGALEQAARSLSEALQDTSGQGANLRSKLQGMGIDVQDLSGNQLELGGILEEVLQKLSYIPGTAARIHQANELIGRGAVALQPVIKSYADLRKVVIDAGVGLDEGLIKRFSQTDDQMDLMSEKLNILKRQLMAPIDYAAGSLAEFLLRGGGPNRDLHGDFSVTPPGGMRFKPPDAGNFPGTGIKLVDPLDKDAQKFRDANSHTMDALRQQIAENNQKAAKLTENLSGRLNRESRSSLEAQLNTIKDGTKALEDEIERANERKEIEKSILDLMQQQNAAAAARALGKDAVPALQSLQRELLKDGLTSSDKLKIANALSPEIQAQQADADKKAQEIIGKLSRDYQAQGLVARQAGIGSDSAQSITAIGAASRPGEEEQTQRIIAQVRIDAAKQNFELEKQRITLEHAGDDDKVKFLNTMIDLAKARGDKDKEIGDAEADRDAKILAIERERTDLAKQRSRDLGIAQLADREQRIQGDADRQIRSLQASAGPGQEISTASKVEQLRQDAAQKVFDLEVQRLDVATRDMDAEAQESARNLENIKLISDLEKSRQDASLEYWDTVLSLQRAQEQQSRDAAGRTFDAITASGKDAFAQLGQTALKTFERQVFVNITSVAFDQARKAASTAIPGQVDKNGNLTTLGKIFQGTPLGIDPLKQATIDQTRATRDLTAEFRKYNNGSSSGGSIPTLLDRPLLRTPGFSPEDDLKDSKVIKDASDKEADVQKEGTAAIKSLTNKLVGIGGATAIGAAGVVGGVAQGGLQGAVAAAGSVATTLGTVLPQISKSLSIAGPIGAIAGLGLSLVSSLLPNAKEKFDSEQDATIKKNAYVAPTAQSQNADATGSGNLGTNLRGAPNVTVQFNVNAIDTKGVKAFFDAHSTTIAELVGKATQGGQSPNMTLAINKTAFPGS